MHQPHKADQRQAASRPHAAAPPGAHVYPPPGLPGTSFLWATLASLLSVAGALFWLGERISALEVRFAEHVEVARRAVERAPTPAPTPAPSLGDAPPAEHVLRDSPALTPPIKPFTPKVNAAAGSGVRPQRRSGNRSGRKGRSGAALSQPSTGVR